MPYQPYQHDFKRTGREFLRYECVGCGTRFATRDGARLHRRRRST